VLLADPEPVNKSCKDHPCTDLNTLENSSPEREEVEFLYILYITSNKLRFENELKVFI
jgi:hypothetical protein